MPPALVIHGKADDVMPISASEEFVAAYNAAGGPAQLKPFEGNGHGWGQEPSSTSWCGRSRITSPGGLANQAINQPGIRIHA